MVMWIVLGSLIGVVVIFLVVSSTLDRKKSKKLKIEKELLSKEITDAGTIISKNITKIIETNHKSIKNFVPSVGKIKMSDINKKAKDALKEIQHSKNFKLLKHNINKFNLFSNHIESLINEKSNNWEKRNKKDMIFFIKFKEEDLEKIEKNKSKKPKKINNNEIKKSSSPKKIVVKKQTKKQKPGTTKKVIAKKQTKKQKPETTKKVIAKKQTKKQKPGTTKKVIAKKTIKKGEK